MRPYPAIILPITGILLITNIKNEDKRKHAKAVSGMLRTGLHNL
jgi:hypothetical protein